MTGAWRGHIRQSREQPKSRIVHFRRGDYAGTGPMGRFYATCHKYLSVAQNGRHVFGPNTVHASRAEKSALGGVVQSSVVDYYIAIDTAGDQNLAIG